MRSYLSFVLGILMAASIHAQETREVKGILQETDIPNGTISLLVVDFGKTKVSSFNLFKADIPIFDDSGKPLKWADVPVETRVTLRVSLQGDVVEMRAALPTLYGTIQKLQPAKRELILKSSLGEKTLLVPDEAKITISSQPAKLENLPLGATIAVMLSQDHKQVLEIRTIKSKTTGIKLVKSTGILIDSNPEKHRVQMYTSSSLGDTSILRDYDLTRDATFSLVYQGNTFRDLNIEELARGIKVNYWIDNSLKKLFHLQVEMPTLGKRQIKEIRPQTKEIVLDDGAKDRVIVLSPKTKIWSKTIHGTWDDLKEQGWVSVGLSPDRKYAEVVVVHPK